MSRVRIAVAASLFVLFATSVSAGGWVDPLITSGDPLPFPKGAQNEVAIAVDMSPQAGGKVLAAGANDYIQQTRLCDPDCEFDPNVGISGVYFSFDGGQTHWLQPTYKTVPRYSAKSLATRGDPSVAFGPRLKG